MLMTTSFFFQFRFRSKIDVIVIKFLFHLIFCVVSIKNKFGWAKKYCDYEYVNRIVNNNITQINIFNFKNFHVMFILFTYYFAETETLQNI